MRSLLRLLVLGLAAAFIWIFHPPMHDHWQTLLHRWQSRRSTEQAVRSTAYPLHTSRWLEFDLPPNAIALRLLTNAALDNTSLPPIERERPRRGWKYSIDYHLLDFRRDPEAPKRYHFRTLIAHAQVRGNSHAQGHTWFQDVPLAPAQTRTVQIPLTSLEHRPRRIRVRLATHDPQVQEVVTRVYFKHERPDFEQPYAWSRLSLDAQQRLCRASVYPPDLLTSGEQRNLLRWNWTALAPRGHQGVHYEHRLIYTREDADTVDLEFLPPPDGIVCRPSFPVTIPTPSERGTVRLSFFPDHKRTRVERAAAEVWLHRKFVGTVAHHEVHLDQMRGPLAIETAGDLLKIVANDHLSCVAHWRPARPNGSEADESLTLDSSAETVRAHLIEARMPVCYSIAHVHTLATPLRVTLRTLARRPPNAAPNGEALPLPFTLPPGAVTYEFLDQQNRVVRRGQLEALSSVAHYDRASIGSAAMFVSEPATYFFSVPESVHQVRFHQEQGDVAVIAFTRPADLPRSFRIPEEQGLYGQQEEIGRTWFIFQPDDHLQRIADNRCVDIRIQTRPPEPHALLTSGQYEWEDHRPREFTTGRFVLTPRDSEFPVRDEGVVATYHPVPLDEPIRVQWRPDDPHLPLEPRLIYVAPHHSTDSIQLWIDGALHHESVPRACRGEIRLPTVVNSHGTHTVRVTAPAGTEVYLRNIASTTASAYTKRFMYQLPSEGLSFDVVKHGRETEQLVLRTLLLSSDTPSSPQTTTISSASADRPRQRVHVHLIGIEARPEGPLSGWTLEQRVFDIAPSQAPAAIVLADSLPSVGQSSTCAIVLDEDLKPGTYQLRVRQLDPPEAMALVSLYRVRPPEPIRREVNLSRWDEPDVQLRTRPAERVLP